MVRFFGLDIDEMISSQRLLKDLCAISEDPRAAGKYVVLVLGEKAQYEVRTFEGNRRGRVLACRFRDSLPEKDRHVGLQPRYISKPGEGPIMMC